MMELNISVHGSYLLHMENENMCLKFLWFIYAYTYCQMDGWSLYSEHRKYCLPYVIKFDLVNIQTFNYLYPSCDSCIVDLSC